MDNGGLETSVEHIVVMIMSQRGDDLLFPSSISSSISIKWSMGTSVMGGNLLSMKSDFTFVILVSLNCT